MFFTGDLKGVELIHAHNVIGVILVVWATVVTRELTLLAPSAARQTRMNSGKYSGHMKKTLWVFQLLSGMSR